jgi:hypothetical protein
MNVRLPKGVLRTGAHYSFGFDGAGEGPVLGLESVFLSVDGIVFGFDSFVSVFAFL